MSANLHLLLSQAKDALINLTTLDLDSKDQNNLVLSNGGNSFLSKAQYREEIRSEDCVKQL